jgi:hypothetical protein
VRAYPAYKIAISITTPDDAVTMKITLHDCDREGLRSNPMMKPIVDLLEESIEDKQRTSELSGLPPQ